MAFILYLKFFFLQQSAYKGTVKILHKKTNWIICFQVKDKKINNVDDDKMMAIINQQVVVLKKIPD